MIRGDEAARIGLVTAVDADPVARALAWAEALSAGSPDAVAVGKRALLGGWHDAPASMLGRERHGQRRLLGGVNQRLAMRRGRRTEEAPPPWHPRRLR